MEGGRVEGRSGGGYRRCRAELVRVGDGGLKTESSMEPGELGRVTSIAPRFFSFFSFFCAECDWVLLNSKASEAHGGVA
jgi:hypothetical protein